jgi:2-polyprenyl-3-methyl-5-hydroxy-6-metoxy-1,4-benzoquinol methylase
MSSQPPAPPPATSESQYVWQTCLDVEGALATPYQTHLSPELFDLMTHPPRVLLDVGCSTGNLGKYAKTLHPACRTIGIEPNRATAAIAAENLDQVLCGKFEDFEFESEGIAPGSVDTVVLADVLEHMYDPWRAMVKLKPSLSADAQIILSIPNTRHIGLMRALLDGGAWTYAERGLLDITHIRFFTLKEIGTFLAQTGYKMERINYFLDAGLTPLYEQNKSNPHTSVRLGRVTMDNVTPNELAELCDWQFYIRAKVV